MGMLTVERLNRDSAVLVDLVIKVDEFESIIVLRGRDTTMHAPCPIGVITENTRDLIMTGAEFGDRGPLGFVVGDEFAIGVDLDNGGGFF